MSIDVRKTQYVNPSSTVSSTARTSSAQKNVPVGGNASTQTTTQAKNTSHVSDNTKLDKNLENALIPVCKKYGIDWAKFKQQADNLIKTLGIEVNVRAGKALTPEQVNKIVVKFQKLLEQFTPGEEITPEKLLKAFTEQTDKKMLAKAGISEEEYAKMLKNGEAKSLRDLLGLGPNEEITAEKVAEYMIKKNEEFKANIESITDPEAKKTAIKEYIENEFKSLILTMASTPLEDRVHLLGAIKHTSADNRTKFFKTLLESLDYETRLEIANSFNNEKIKEILLNPDILGKTVENQNDIQDLEQTVTRNQDASHIVTNQNDLISEFEKFKEENSINDEFVAEFNKKKEAERRGEKVEYSEVEKLYDFYTSRLAGKATGTANNLFITQEQCNGILETYNSNLYDLPGYEDVMSKVSEFANNNPEELIMSQEDFTQLMDKATNNNYSNIALSGNEAVLNPPVVSESSQTVVSNLITVVSQPANNQNPILGFNSKEEKPIDNAKETKEKLYQQSKTTEVTTVADYDNYEKENGKIATIKHIFTSCKTNKSLVEKAKDRFAGLNTSLQFMTLRFGINNFGLSQLLPEASLATLERAKGQTFSNTWATNLVQDRVEEQEEKERKLV